MCGRETPKIEIKTAMEYFQDILFSGEMAVLCPTIADVFTDTWIVGTSQLAAPFPRKGQLLMKMRMTILATK